MPTSEIVVRQFRQVIRGVYDTREKFQRLNKRNSARTQRIGLASTHKTTSTRIFFTVSLRVCAGTSAQVLRQGRLPPRPTHVPAPQSGSRTLGGKGACRSLDH